MTEIRLSEVLSALSYALDITEGQPEGHAIRNCMIGMTLAQHMGLDSDQRSELFYALLLKDLGCSSNAAKITYLFDGDDHSLKYRLKTVDWSNLLHSAFYVFRNAAPHKSLFERMSRIISLGLKGRPAARGVIKTRCERGADIARMLGFPEGTAQAILDLDEHWDGKGDPKGLKGEQISLLGRILGFSQTVEVFFSAYGPDGASKVARQRRATWFDPEMVDLFLATYANDRSFWQKLKSADLISEISTFEPMDRVLRGDDEQLDKIAEAFAGVVDAKSTYTYRHSVRVADIVVGIAKQLHMPPTELRDLSRAALLHDIGKLGVSNLILDKKDKLNNLEWEAVRRHTAFTYNILRRVNVFSHLANMASAHHERLDGTGYHRHMKESELPAGARMLAVADQYEALTARRPYRAALLPEQALQILGEQVGTGIDEQAYEALQAMLAQGGGKPPIN